MWRIAFILLAVTLVPSPSFGQHRSGRSRSLQPGITRQQQAIASVNKEIENTWEEALKLIGDSSIEQLGAQAKFLLNEYQANNAAREGDVGNFIQHSAEVIATLAAEESKKGALAVGDTALGLATTEAEVASILARVAYLEMVKHVAMLPALHTLQQKQAQNRKIVSWKNLYTKLEQDEVTSSRILTINGVSRPEQLKTALNDAAHIGPHAALEVGSGMVTTDSEQDPCQLPGLPAFNPDFIRALVQERDMVQEALRESNDDLLEAAFWVNKYGVRGSGGYIPVFGSSRGGNSTGCAPQKKGGLLLTAPSMVADPTLRTPADTARTLAAEGHPCSYSVGVPGGRGIVGSAYLGTPIQLEPGTYVVYWCDSMRTTVTVQHGQTTTLQLGIIKVFASTRGAGVGVYTIPANSSNEIGIGTHLGAGETAEAGLLPGTFEVQAYYDPLPGRTFGKLVKQTVQVVAGQTTEVNF